MRIEKSRHTGCVTAHRERLAPPPGNEDVAMDVVFGFGQVGQALARELRSRGKSVRVVSRSGRGPVVDGVEHVKGDATSPPFCRAMCTGAEVVYLCLNAPYDRWAEELPPLQEAVLAGAEAASSKLVVLENLYMYGPHDGPLTEELPHAATDTKGMTRAKMNEALLAAHRNGRVRVAIGRASDFFGPGVIASQLGERAFAPLLAGKAVQMIGDPDAPHSYAYVPDVARALATLGERDEADGRVWHLPSVETRSTREMLGLAGQIAGVEAKVAAIAPVLLAVLARVNPMVREVHAVGYQLDRPFVVDSSAFERAFDIGATPLEEALTATIDWYRARPGTSHAPWCHGCVGARSIRPRQPADRASRARDSVCRRLGAHAGNTRHRDRGRRWPLLAAAATPRIDRRRPSDSPSALAPSAPQRNVDPWPTGAVTPSWSEVAR
jgi:nucleoside-diphosphate-sugar epimerase